MSLIDCCSIHPTVLKKASSCVQCCVLLCSTLSALLCATMGSFLLLYLFPLVNLLARLSDECYPVVYVVLLNFHFLIVQVEGGCWPYYPVQCPRRRGLASSMYSLLALLHYTLCCQQEVAGGDYLPLPFLEELRLPSSEMFKSSSSEEPGLWVRLGSSVFGCRVFFTYGIWVFNHLYRLFIQDENARPLPRKWGCHGRVGKS